MQINTARIDVPSNAAGNFPSKKGKSEPYLISNGHYVGDDGFIVPKDFAEFFDRFPEYVERWVRRHCGRAARAEDAQDWTQDLKLHLMALPPTSKYRREGKQDVIETFDPERQHGANQARFQNFINLCLMNKFRTIQTRRKKEPICRQGTLSIVPKAEPDAHGTVEDQYCHAHSIRLRAESDSRFRQAERRLRIEEFVRYIDQNDERSKMVISAMLCGGLPKEAAAMARMTGEEFMRAQRRLRHKAEKFEAGTVAERGAA